MIQDITFCASKCDNKQCFRHLSNVEHPEYPHSYAYFKGTNDCIIEIEKANQEVTITERGWAGHFVGSKSCLFRRNTLIQYGDKKWVVSTVGSYINMNNNIDTIGHNRWYETMAFESKYDEYDDADISKPISFESDWSLYAETWDDLEKEFPKPDIAANNMHEKVVKELSEKIKEEK